VKDRIWINFKELRARLRFEDVLRYYKVDVHCKGDQHQGPCPLPGHTGSGAAPSFSANLKRGIFHCFSCGGKGNVLEFAALMEGVDVWDGDELRKVAVKLQSQFFPEGLSTRKRPGPVAVPVVAEAATPSVLVNAPMDFELRGLDRNHEFFSRHGLTLGTVEHFGLGFCTRGLIKDRIAIPLHDVGGRLIGYAGKVVDDALITGENPPYRFPPKRERDGKVLDFRRSAFLYNGHRIKAPCDDLFVVEQFPSVWWLHQNGFPNAVGLMGGECSEMQIELIVEAVKPDGRVWILPDGGKAGEELAHSLVLQVSSRRFVRWVRLAEGSQPTDMRPEELTASFVP
jgi:DNA primase